MIVNELISNIQSYFNNGVKSDDYLLSDRLIYKELLNTRSTLLFNKIKQLKGYNIGDNNFSVINCIKLTDVDAASCPCIPAKGCIVKRSLYQLPTFLATAYGDYIEYVRSIDGRIKFDKSSLAEQEDKEYREYGKKANEYFFENKYLWIYTNKDYEDLEFVRLKGIFEDPILVNDFMVKNDCICVKNDTVCTAYDVEFKIDKELTKLLLDTVMSNIYKFFLITNNDSSNNSRGDLSGNSRRPTQPQESTKRQDTE